MAVNSSHLYLIVHEFMCTQPVILCARIISDGHCFSGPAPVGGSYRVTYTGHGTPGNSDRSHLFSYHRQSPDCTGPASTKETGLHACGRYTLGAFTLSTHRGSIRGCMDCTGSSCVSPAATVATGQVTDIEVFSNDNITRGIGLVVATMAASIIIGSICLHVWIACWGDEGVHPTDAHESHHCSRLYEESVCSEPTCPIPPLSEADHYRTHIPWVETGVYPETDPPGYVT